MFPVAQKQFATDNNILFLEFLREGRALLDKLNLFRIIADHLTSYQLSNGRKREIAHLSWKSGQ